VQHDEALDEEQSDSGLLGFGSVIMTELRLVESAVAARVLLLNFFDFADLLSSLLILILVRVLHSIITTKIIIRI